MAAKPKGNYDTSQLTEQNRGQSVNRDYLAHCFRWGWVRRFIEPGKTRVLDIGCGRDTPLSGVLAQSTKGFPAMYLGVDVQAIKERGIAWWNCEGEFSFPTRWQELKDAGLEFDLAVSFESIEHMPKEDGTRLLEGARALLAPGGTFLLSTPVFNGKAAAAHVHEYTISELMDAINAAGMNVVRRFGTFASYNVLAPRLPPEERALLDELRDFYSDDVMACFLAPKYPDLSRNNVWVCTRDDEPVS